MVEDEKTTSGAVPRLVQEFTAQLGAITGRLEDLAGLGGGNPRAPGALPLPGGLSAAQMTSIADSIAAQRRRKPSCPPSTSNSRCWSRSSARSLSGAGHGPSSNSGC